MAFDSLLPCHTKVSTMTKYFSETLGMIEAITNNVKEDTHTIKISRSFIECFNLKIY
jgi:hypothetical protein